MALGTLLTIAGIGLQLWGRSESAENSLYNARVSAELQRMQADIDDENARLIRLWTPREAEKVRTEGKMFLAKQRVQQAGSGLVSQNYGVLDDYTAKQNELDALAVMLEGKYAAKALEDKAKYGRKSADLTEKAGEKAAETQELGMIGDVISGLKDIID